MSPEETEGDVSTPEKGDDWNKWLIEETERFEAEKRQLEADVSRMKRENAHLKGELARLRAPPQVIGTVTDRLKDGRVSIKSSSGPDFVVHISEGIDKENLEAGDRVALHRQTLAVLESLPSTKDPLVMGAEVDSKPIENYKDTNISRVSDWIPSPFYSLVFLGPLLIHNSDLLFALQGIIIIYLTYRISFFL